MLPMLPLLPLLCCRQARGFSPLITSRRGYTLSCRRYNPERPEKGRNRDLPVIAWSTCKSSYIRNQGRALIRMVPVWAGGPSRITSYTTSPVYHPLQDAFGQECYTLWEQECKFSGVIR